MASPEERKRRLLPAGFRIASADGKIAQMAKNPLFMETLEWNEENQTWEKAVTGMEMAGPNLPRHMWVSHRGGESGQHYSWDNQRQLWIHIPNPQRPPPEGASLSPTRPGFAWALMPDETERHYQWSEEEQRWVMFEVPRGFTENIVSQVPGRFEALSLDDYRTRIYWDLKKQEWIDTKSGAAASARPAPPLESEVVGFYENGDYNTGNMVKTNTGDRYFRWSKGKQRWVMLTDPPEGFKRGKDPNEAHLGNGSALDRWIEWDNEKEAWVDFDPGRRLKMGGRIQ